MGYKHLKGRENCMVSVVDKWILFLFLCLLFMMPSAKSEATDKPIEILPLL